MTSEPTDLDELLGVATPDEKPAGDEKPKATRKPRAAKPKADEKPATKGEPIDTAVRIRRLDWECECGNTNTHSLQRCGKCNLPRYR